MLSTNSVGLPLTDEDLCAEITAAEFTILVCEEALKLSFSILGEHIADDASLTMAKIATVREQIARTESTLIILKAEKLRRSTHVQSN